MLSLASGTGAGLGDALGDALDEAFDEALDDAAGDSLFGWVPMEPALAPRTVLGLEALFGPMAGHGLQPTVWKAIGYASKQSFHTSRSSSSKKAFF